MRITVRVALPRRFFAVPARTSTTKRFAPRSLRAAFAERIVTLTFLPALTFLKVVASALLAVVRTRARRSVAPAGTVTLTVTPVVASAAAVTVAGAVTRAARRGAGAAAPASGTAAPMARGPAAAAAATGPPGGGPAAGSGAASWRPSIGRQFHSSAGASVALSPTTAVLP